MLSDASDEKKYTSDSLLRKNFKKLEYKFPNNIFNNRLDNKFKKQFEISPKILRKKLEEIGFELHMVEHHECHTYSPLAIYGDTDEEFLIFALDGSGDLNSATVSVYRNGKDCRNTTS